MGRGCLLTEWQASRGYAYNPPRSRAPFSSRQALEYLAAKAWPRICKFAQAARLVDTDDTKIMRKQHPHDAEGM